MKRLLLAISILFLFAGLLLRPTNVYAQDEIVPHVFDTTTPVEAGIRESINAWLISNNPSIGKFYAITYFHADGMDEWVVCLAAVDISSDDQPWSLTENEDEVNQLIWVGTVKVNFDGSVTLLTDPQSAMQSSAPKLSVLLPAPGGGIGIRWPFESGKSAMYGPRGVHPAGYTTYGAGMMAIDIVSGSNFGSGAANDRVFASAPGAIDFICEDGTSVTLRINDGSNKFIYSHLVNNSFYEIGRDYSAGEYIGSLVHGSFDDECGYAKQQANHWHLHWGFEIANNSFRVENCTINTRTDTISCGDKKINPSQFIVSDGFTVDGEHGTGYGNPTFWDYLLVGFLSTFDRGIIKLLPEHSSPTLMVQPIMVTIRFVLKISYALIVSNFNVRPAITAVFFALTFRAVLVPVKFLFILFRTVKSVPWVD